MRSASARNISTFNSHATDLMNGWTVKLTCCMLVMPSTKQMESRMLDLPLPLSPVMALNCWSSPKTVVRFAKLLKPSRVISSIHMPLLRRACRTLPAGNECVGGDHRTGQDCVHSNIVLIERSGGRCVARPHQCCMYALLPEASDCSSRCS